VSLPTNTREPTPTSQRRRPSSSRFAVATVPGAHRWLGNLDEQSRTAVLRRDRAFRGGMLVADIVAAAIVVALEVSWLGARGPSWTGLLLPAVIPVILAGQGAYRRDEQVINKSTLEEASTLFQGATLATLIVFLAESFIVRHVMGGTVVATTWLALSVALPACRVAARAIVRDVTPPERCLVVGDHDHGRRLGMKLTQDPGLNVRLVGVISIDAEGETAEQRRGRTLQQLTDAVQGHDVHRIVVAYGVEEPTRELDAIEAAKALGVKVSVLPRVLEVVGSSAAYDYVGGLTVLGVPRFGLSAYSRIVKRVFDLVGSALLLLFAAPVMATIAIAIKLTSPGPVFFRQTRIGRDGQAFTMYKFRSMHDRADELKEQLRALNEVEGLFKIADDPRITGVGKLLRRTSLDELPQLFNVLAGEMSLVGPRPLVPEEDREIRGWHRRRLELTPGMTGPWQVLGPARVPLREMVTIDYLYVANWRLWGDIKILLRTVGAVFARRGL
jgi:exopolysaccharide biosynthesis polyprenyl glycosylphosphotransferase